MSNDPLSELPPDLSVCGVCYLGTVDIDTQVETERIATDRNTQKCARVIFIRTHFVCVSCVVYFFL